MTTSFTYTRSLHIKHHPAPPGAKLFAPLKALAQALKAHADTPIPLQVGR